MNQLSPQELFPIVYILADPNDTGTYFVRSVMRNSATGAVIQIAGQNFVNLTSIGSGRFTKNIQAPSDPSGLGFWIDVVTIVYTDAGYTTPSSSYVQQCDKYLVQTRWNTSLGVGGGGFSKPAELDPILLKKIILEAFGELPTTELPAFDLSPALGRFDALEGKLQALKPTQQEPDFTDLVDRLTLAFRKELAKQKLTDLSPVLKKIEAIEFPEIPTAKDYTGELAKITKALELLKTSIPKQKYSDFLDEIVTKNLEGEAAHTNTARIERLAGRAAPSDRLTRLIS